MQKSTKTMLELSAASLALWELGNYLKKKRQKNAAIVCPFGFCPKFRTKR